MILIVCGGRDYADGAALDAAMQSVVATLQPDERLVIVDGGARGADRMGGMWAQGHGHVRVTVHANWDKEGKAAGYTRNERMAHIAMALAAGDRLMVAAFPGGRGTAHMVRVAKANNITVWEPYGAMQ